MATRRLAPPGQDDIDGAFISWINACQADRSVASMQDLADGYAFAILLHTYLPDSFSSPSATSFRQMPAEQRLESLCSQLDANLQGELGLVDRVVCSAAASSAEGLGSLRLLAEAVLFASVKGPHKDKAVLAIQGLAEAQRMALLHRCMTLATVAAQNGSSSAKVGPGGGRQRRPQATDESSNGSSVARGGGYLTRRRERGGGDKERGRRRPRTRRAAGSPSPTPSGTPVPSVLSAVGGDQDAASLRRHLSGLQKRIEEVSLLRQEAERSELRAREQLRNAQVDVHDEENVVAQDRVKMQRFMRSCGDDLRKGDAEERQLREELVEVASKIEAGPSLEAALEVRLEAEEEEVVKLQTRATDLELEMNAASKPTEDAGLDMELRTETASEQILYDKLSEELSHCEAQEVLQRNKSAEMWQDMCDCEAKDRTFTMNLRYLRRQYEQTEQHEQDAVGILQFRRSELAQMDLEADAGLDTEESDLPPIAGGSSGGSRGDPLKQERQKLFFELSAARSRGRQWEQEYREAFKRSEAIAQSVLKREAELSMQSFEDSTKVKARTAKAEEDEIAEQRSRELQEANRHAQEQASEARSLRARLRAEEASVVRCRADLAAEKRAAEEHRKAVATRIQPAQDDRREDKRAAALPAQSAAQPTAQSGLSASEPAAQPAQPAAQPTVQNGASASEPATRPAQPAAQPAAQSGLSASEPATQPAQPVAQTTAQNGVPASQPAIWPAQPAAQPTDQLGPRASEPATQPAQPAAQTTAQNGVPASQPATQPAQPAAQPTAQNDLPASQPATLRGQPAAQPAAHVSQPASQPATQPAQPAAHPTAQFGLPASEPATLAGQSAAQLGQPASQPATQMGQLAKESQLSHRIAEERRRYAEEDRERQRAAEEQSERQQAAEEQKERQSAESQREKEERQRAADEQKEKHRANEAVLRRMAKLRTQLRQREVQLQNMELRFQERRRTMQNETQVLSGAFHDIGIRCHALVSRHRALVDASGLAEPPT